MSVLIDKSGDVYYNGTHNVSLMEVFIDSASDLTGLVSVESIYFQLGSKATDVSTGDVYRCDSNGVWHLQPSESIQLDLTGYYTSAQTDTLLAGKQDTLSASQMNAVNSGITSTIVNTITAVLPELVDNGAKNKLYFTETKTGQDAGCVYTVNADGTITVDVSGKTGNSYRVLSIGNVDQTIDEFCDGTFVLSGCPSGGGASNSYRLYAAKSTYSAYDYGSGVTLPSRGSVTGINVVIYIDSDYTGGNLTFKPMVCKKAEWDISHEFVPYCPSLYELYQMILALQ